MPTTKAEIITSSGRSVDEIRANIRICMRNMVNNALEIGTDLLEMKEACRHGEWLPFLKELGLSASTAANYMRIASEVTTGSKLSRLPYTKILAVLAAPPEDREELTEAAESLSAAEIRKITEEKNREVQRMREERDRAAEAANTETARADQAESDAKRFYAENAGLQTKLQSVEQDRDKVREEISQLRMKLSYTDGCNEALQKKLDDQQAKFRTEITRAESEICDLKARLLEAENNRVEVEVAPADYERLKAEQKELLEAAAQAEERANDAETKLEQMRMDASGQADARPVGIVLGQAMNAFFGECEMLPFSPEELQRDRYAVEHCLGMIRDWCRRMDDALSTTIISEVHVV